MPIGDLNSSTCTTRLTAAMSGEGMLLFCLNRNCASSSIVHNRNRRGSRTASHTHSAVSLCLSVFKRWRCFRDIEPQLLALLSLRWLNSRALMRVVFPSPSSMVAAHKHPPRNNRIQMQRRALNVCVCVCMGLIRVCMFMGRKISCTQIAHHFLLWCRAFEYICKNYGD